MEDSSSIKTRKRRTSPLIESSSVGLKLSSSLIETPLKIFDDLAKKIQEAETEFTELQKEIQEVRGLWQKEKINHDQAVAELGDKEESARRRRQEEWAYEFSQKEKRAAEEFNEKKLKWEKELEGQKEIIESERKELIELRQRVEKFDGEKERAVKEASSILTKDLNERYQNEKRLADQAVASEKEILELKISQPVLENTRLNKELDATKKSLDEASRQLKEIALKVIEAGGGGVKAASTPSPSD